MDKFHFEKTYKDGSKVICGQDQTLPPNYIAVAQTEVQISGAHTSHHKKIDEKGLENQIDQITKLQHIRAKLRKKLAQRKHASSS